jgi:hypothetical protein
MATPANLLLCKLCKKTTKRRMDEHISDRHPIIEIGSNKFQLISKNVTKEYLFILIRNIGHDFTFLVYRSNSHGGIFRLCTRTTEGEMHLYKGLDDYVTQTFIHIELQKFIIENYEKLITNPELSIEKCPCVQSKINPKDPDPKSLYYHELVDGTNQYRKYKNNISILKILNDFKCGEGFANIETLLTKLEEGKGGILELDYQKFMMDIYKIFNPKYGTNGPEKCLRKSSCPLTTKLKETRDIEIRKKIVRKYLEYISDYLNETFDILPGTNKKLYSDNFTIPKIKDVLISMHYCSVDIQTKSGKTKYEYIREISKFTIIYAIYEIKSSTHKISNGIYSMTFNIIPMTNIVDDKIVENSINRLGLYRFYTSIGIYLCKLFDYVQQVGAIAEYDKIVGDYVFLGDLYDGLFPVNKLYPSYKLK